MQLKTLFTFLASLALALANSVTFKSLDGIHRTIVFTPSAGHPGIPDARVPAGQSVRVSIPHGWIGNWYSVSDGAPRVPGMLGEVTFQGWNDLTYFDVSAIVNPNDHQGVKEIYPASSSGNVSGCSLFPCNNAYYQPDDVQTKTTKETDLVCTLGGSGGQKRNVFEAEEQGENVKRSFVLRGY